jgi:hypothetical protein
MITKAQEKLLVALMRNGARSPYGAEHSTARALAVRDLVTNARGRLRITIKGLGALESHRQAKWAKHGCVAYLEDLKEVTEALKLRIAREGGSQS